MEAQTAKFKRDFSGFGFRFCKAMSLVVHCPAFTDPGDLDP